MMPKMTNIEPPIVIRYIADVSRGLAGNKNGTSQNSDEKSRSVPRAGLRFARTVTACSAIAKVNRSAIYFFVYSS
jgi:hypothetical protein